MLDLMFITNEPKIASYVEKAGVGRIFIDLESLGKRERQKNRDTYISNHVIGDIDVVKDVIKKIPVMVRINPFFENTQSEIEECIARGADIIMLPMFRGVEEVKRLVQYVRGRARVCLLLETPQAMVRIHDIVKCDGIDEIHVGLNDLHLAMNLDFMFELLNGGVVDYLAGVVKEAGIKFGFGGLAKIGQGVIPSEIIIGEHYRLGSEMAILSRSFRRDAETFEKLNMEIQKVRVCEEDIKKNWGIAQFETNRKRLDNIIKSHLSDKKAEVDNGK